MMQNLDEVEVAKGIRKDNPRPPGRVWGHGRAKGAGSGVSGPTKDSNPPTGSLGTGLCFHNCFENLLKAKTPLPRKIYGHI